MQQVTTPTEPGTALQRAVQRVRETARSVLAGSADRKELVRAETDLATERALAHAQRQQQAETKRADRAEARRQAEAQLAAMQSELSQLRDQSEQIATDVAAALLSAWHARDGEPALLERSSTLAEEIRALSERLGAPTRVASIPFSSIAISSSARVWQALAGESRALAEYLLSL